jgi:excisionase family DNA binding protein
VIRRDEPIEPRPITCRAERAASLLGVSTRMLEQLARDGAIPSFKLADRVRLYRVADLEEWSAELSNRLPSAPSPSEGGRLPVGGPGAPT